MIPNSLHMKLNNLIITRPQSPDSAVNPQPSLPAWAIAMIVVGVMLIVDAVSIAVITFAICFHYRKKKRICDGKKETNTSSERNNCTN